MTRIEFVKFSKTKDADMSSYSDTTGSLNLSPPPNYPWPDYMEYIDFSYSYSAVATWADFFESARMTGIKIWHVSSKHICKNYIFYNSYHF